MTNHFVPVHHIRMVEDLIRRGYTLKGVVDNKTNPQLKVFLFYDTNNIEQTIEELKAKYVK